MENNNILLTKAEALARLPFGRYSFEGLINRGEIGFKKVGGRYYFLLSDIEKWSQELEHRTKSTNDLVGTGHTLLSKPKTETVSGLDALAIQRALEKQKSSATRKLQAYNKKPLVKPLVSFQA